MSGQINKKSSRNIKNPASSSPGASAHCEKAQIAVSLQRCAETMLSEGMAESAIPLLCSALMADPGRSLLIHKIGQCLDASGFKEDAVSCYRGSLPDSINEKYFASSTLAKLIKPASSCDQVNYMEAFGSEKIDLQVPVRNITDKQYGQFNYPKTNARETFCTIANSGSVWFDGFNTLALDSNGCIIKEQSKGNEFACYHTTKISEARRLNGTACFLDGRSSKIYYHWMLDILPKLGILSEAGIQLNDIDYFIVSASSGFQLDTLLACGVREDQLVFDHETSFYQADKMIVPCLRNDLGERIYYGLGVGLASWIPVYLQKKFTCTENPVTEAPTVSDVSGTKEPTTPVKVYISRSTRGSRNIANEPAMIEALQLRGFTTVEFETLTVVQQAELMARAEVVVGVHGAGFTNLSFCKPGTRVIEIFGDYVVPCYWALCAVAGLRYAQFMADSVAVGADNKAGKVASTSNPGQRVAELRNLEINVNVEAFTEFLDETLGDELTTPDDILAGTVGAGCAASA